MSKIYRIKLSILLIVCAAVCLSASCAAGPPRETEPMTDMPIYEYTLVRGDASDGATLKQIVALKNAIESRYGKAPASSTDWAQDARQAEQTKRREILVGITNREESVRANGLLEGKKGYVIESSNEYFVITASSGKLLESAVNVFVSSYLDISKDGLLPADIRIVRTDNAAFYL